MSVADGPQRLWATPLAVGRVQDADAIGADLLPLFRRHRDKHGADPEAAVYASSDDLLRRYQRPALQTLLRALSDALFKAAEAANAEAWARLPSARLRVEVVGAWFQVSNRYGAHGIHNHGNCSWSGVYVLAVDPPEVRRAHPVLGAANGVTRFHGPHLAHLGGAHMDLGRAYLQDSHVDVEPEAGRYALFPSHLLHEALPYDGAEDRVILSFNAQLLGATGDAVRPFGF